MTFAWPKETYTAPPRSYRRVSFHQRQVLNHPFITGLDGEGRSERGQDQGAKKSKKKKQKRQQVARQVSGTATQSQAETAAAVPATSDELTAEELIAFLSGVLTQ
ncbi:MAG: hypothetical protein J3R72DRAFT_421114 [Linnemannia gamsii]|nr:MAG: hypothetical protein J3R72DRAFT_421114 [Linnemannia gamsii]